MKMNNNYHFFLNGPLSQWYKTFTPFWDEQSEMTYNCAEQFMMAHKAILFNDKEALKKIMQTGLPKIQKAIGREVKGFNLEEWNQVCEQVVYRGNSLKFTQDHNCRDYLLNTYPALLVETNPRDQIWAIGYTEKDAIRNINDWGENKLGKILTELRNDIMAKATKDYKFDWVATFDFPAIFSSI